MSFLCPCEHIFSFPRYRRFLKLKTDERYIVCMFEPLSYGNKTTPLIVYKLYMYYVNGTAGSCESKITLSTLLMLPTSSIQKYGALMESKIWYFLTRAAWFLIFQSLYKVFINCLELHLINKFQTIKCTVFRH